jgi:signal transduction histidine kinase
MKTQIFADQARKLFHGLLKSRAAGTVICVATTLLIGLVDYETGYELDFFLFYFAPIAIAAWLVDRPAAIRIALLSAITWLLADLLSNHHSSVWFIEWWNTAIQTSTFLLIAFVVASARRAFDRERNLNADLSEALRSLEEETQERMRLAEKVKVFAYSVSHDLKSPLIGISGLTRLLHEKYHDRLDEKGRTYCDQILKTSEHSLNLIEEINIYIKTKETPLKFESVSPKEILQAVRDEFDPKLRARRIAWREPESIPGITADRVCMLRLFRNLVDNALKYGGEELNELAIGYQELEEFHTFSVADNGAGIDSEDCETVFELFQRRSASQNVEGTGLGLAIVKEIAAHHKGLVWADPGCTKGVTFYVAISKNL